MKKYNVGFSLLGNKLYNSNGYDDDRTAFWYNGWCFSWNRIDFNID